VKTQWRPAPWGLYGLDYGPAIAIIQDMGWRVSLALELLQVVERVVMASRSTG